MGHFWKVKNNEWPKLHYYVETNHFLSHSISFLTLLKLKFGREGLEEREVWAYFLFSNYEGAQTFALRCIRDRKHGESHFFMTIPLTVSSVCLLHADLNPSGTGPL